MRTFVKASLLAVGLVWAASPSSAATLTLVDTFGGTNTTWTLVVEDNCTLACEVTLDADFSNPSAYDGYFLDSFQWVVTDPNTDITSITEASGSGGANWDSEFGQVVNANGCQDTGNDAFTCTVWTGAGEGLLINSGDMLSWMWTVNFADEMLAIEGNIRASFDDANGTNVNIFSPGGGTFGTTTTDVVTTTTEVVTTTTGNIPEPTILTLLGAGLVVAGRRLRRRRTT